MLHRIARDRRDEVVDVLVESFYDYPVMRFTLADESEESYAERLPDLIGFFTDRRFRQQQPVFGVEDEGALVAVSLVDEPQGDGPDVAIGDLVEKVIADIGPSSWDRLVRFGDALDPFEPTFPHFYVGMIGVRPARQGEGHARVILDHVARLSEAHPRSEAVCLTTETPRNVPFYEHLGYVVAGEAHVDDLTSWSLTRRTG